MKEDDKLIFRLEFSRQKDGKFLINGMEAASCNGDKKECLDLN